MIKTLDLRTLGLAEGPHKITVIGKKAYYVQSDPSVEITWTPDWFPITYNTPEFMHVITAPAAILEGHTATLEFAVESELISPRATVSGATFTETLDTSNATYTLVLSDPTGPVDISLVLSGELIITHNLEEANDAEGQTYGFAYIEGSGLVPQNKGVHNSFAWTKLRFSLPVEGSTTMSIYQSSESNFDYGIISSLDAELVKDNSSTTNAYANYYGVSGSRTLTYTNVAAGEHFITAKYRKDGSQNSGSDECRIVSLVSTCSVDIDALCRVYYNIDPALIPLSKTPPLVIPTTDLELQYQLPDINYVPAINIEGIDYDYGIESAVLTLTIHNITTDMTVTIEGNKPQLDPAVIELDGDILNIYDASGLATSATIFVNGEPMATVEIEGEVEEPLDPEFNHYGVIPEGCYLEYNDHDGEYVVLEEGSPFPIDKSVYSSDISNALYHHDNGVYEWRETGWEYACDMGPESGTVTKVLASIDNIPVTTICCLVGYEILDTLITGLVLPNSITTFMSQNGMGNKALSSITYLGTMTEWNNINFETDWNYDCPEITVTCTDGTITIPAYGS